MSGGLLLVAGDLIVRYGRVLKVLGIKDKKVAFAPRFSTQKNGSLTYMIPVKNIAGSNYRRVVSKDKLKNLFGSILTKPMPAEEPGTIAIKSSLGGNSLTETFTVIKTLWSEKKSKAGVLAGGKLSLYQLALEQAVEEVAAVKGIVLDKAKLLIMDALKSKQANQRQAQE
ncbi:hypothetical protein KKH13_00465 [Patescibacteria group bacterium]|nr:hypothetical protein [Patescibacteria group bacterium]